MILIFVFIVWLVLYLTISSYKLNENEHNKLEEFFRGLKQDKKHKLYATMLLFRRLIFVILLITWTSVASRTLVVILTILQLIYFVWLSYLRPYEWRKENLIEILNEIYFSLLLLLLSIFNTEDEWSYSKTTIYMWILVSNTFIIFIIVSCKLVTIKK